MEVILLERIGRLGQMGDVVKVKDGYARNFLLPQGKAMRATKESRLRFEKERVQLEARNLAMKREAEEVGVKLTGKNFVVLRQAGDSGQLYGSVSTRDVSDVITAGGYSIERTQVLLDRPIKALGVQEVRIGLHPEVIVKVNVNVARTEEEAERQARGEDVTQRREEEDEDRIKPEDTYRADDDAAEESDREGEA
ncbi:MAG: 50S ribosomal protein L9 [Chitinophagales bacterium]|nr:50S ribosomal protein L9 [Hyphomicrobiales bacterium]